MGRHLRSLFNFWSSVKGDRNMFRAYSRELQKIVTVYAVDFNHDAFLIDCRGKFRWRSREDFDPIEEEEE